MPPSVIGMAAGALPVRIGISRGSAPQGVALRGSASLGVATLQFLDFREQKALPTLMDPF